MITRRCISLWQPFASLIFSGAKLHETRGRRYPQALDGTTIAIHATKAFTPRELISKALHQLCVDEFGSDYASSLPRGKVLGTVRLDGCQPTTFQGWAGIDDLISGDWTPARYAWKLGAVRALLEPFDHKGAQGWGSVEMPNTHEAYRLVARF